MCVNMVQYPPYVYTATAACIREDTLRHVYIWLPLPSNETYDTLLYDFNVKLGDTLLSNYIGAPDGGAPDIITAIDSIKIGTSYRKQFIVQYSGWDGLALDSIVEGMEAGMVF